MLVPSSPGHIDQEQPKALTQQDLPQGQSRPTDAKPDASPTEAVAAVSAEADHEETEDGEKDVREEDVKQLYDDEAQLCSMPDCADPRLFVDGLALRRYQRQALAWMIERERRRYVTEEDCTGLSVGPSAQEGGVTVGSSISAISDGGPQDGELADMASKQSSGESGFAENDAVSIRDGAVHVAAWEAGGRDIGGGVGVAIHPLWERRAAAAKARPPSTPAAPSGRSTFSEVAGEGRRAADTDGTGSLSCPEAFYVNVYSRRFQREFPRASLGCRGGILADEMGMGKVVFLRWAENWDVVRVDDGCWRDLFRSLAPGLHDSRYSLAVSALTSSVLIGCHLLSPGAGSAI